MNSNAIPQIQPDELTPAQKAIKDVNSRLAAIPQNNPNAIAAPVNQVQQQQLQRPTAFASPIPIPQIIQQQNRPVQSTIMQPQFVKQTAQPLMAAYSQIPPIIQVQPIQNTLPIFQPAAAFEEDIDIEALKAEGITEAEIAALDAEIAQDLAMDEQFIQQQQVSQFVPNQLPPKVSQGETIGNRINKYFPQYNPDSLDRNSLLVLAVAAIGSILLYFIIQFVL